MTTRLARWRAIAMAASVPVLAMACGDDPPHDPLDAEVDAAPIPDARIPDAGPDAADAWVYPDARPDTAWCGVNPFPGVDPNAQELTADPPMWINPFLSRDGTAVVYSHQHDVTEGLEDDVFLFDLSSWSEIRLTDSADTFQGAPSIHGTEVVWADSQFSVGSGSFSVDLVHYDLQSGVETRLTDSRDGNTAPMFNGRQVAYQHFPEGMTITELRLLDLETHEDILLCDTDGAAEGVSISDRFVTWVAIPPWQIYWNKDVYIYDIQTGVTTHLDSTSEYETYLTSVHGSRVVWMDSRHGQWDVYMYDVDTGIETRLTDDPFDQTAPRIHGNVVTFNDYRFTLGWQGNECARDITILDLTTMISRRVTSLPWFWYGIPGEGGQLLAVLKELAGPGTRSKLYMFDLVAMGILDPTGQHVLPEP